MSYDRRVQDHNEAFASDDFPRRVVGADEKKAQEPDLNEITVSDYVAYLFALDTWLRYVEVSTGDEATDHEVTHEGVKLLRILDQRSGEAVRALFRQSLKSRTHLKMVERALDSNPDPRGITLRAFNVRTVLSRGGAALIKAVFPISDKSKKKVLDSIHAASMADTDAGLANLAVIAIHNKVLAAWVDLASETAKSPFTVANANPVQAAVKATLDTKTKLVEQRIVQEGSNPSGDASAQAATNQNDNLTSLETVAAEAAKKVLAQNNEEDRPVTKSEVIGLAVAAATAATAEKDVPETLAFLSAENRKVAMMTGRVRVSAGAGSGKSTTLTAKVTHLVKDKKVEPSSICVAVFNRKPAAELRGKLRRAVGEDAARQIQCSTIHSLFRNIIKNYGTKEQKELFFVLRQNKEGQYEWRSRPKTISEKTIKQNVLKAWAECYPPEEVIKELGDANGEVPLSARWRLPPKPNRMNAWLNKFCGEGWSIAEAKKWALTQSLPENPELTQAIIFYELYEGFKGKLGNNWSPAKFCPTIKSTKAWKATERKRGAPLGDMDDQLKICAQLLRDPTILASVQGIYSHIFVDEAQDMNALQREVFMKMAGKINRGEKDKNLWIVGDPRQSIYGFRGSKVGQFQEMPQVDNMDSGTMMTNRRSVPEIVEHANQLIQHNGEQDIPPAVPHPDKKRGEGSIVVNRPTTLDRGAYDLTQRVAQALKDGAPPEDFAVLTRTNVKLNDFEQSLIYAGIPYVRKKSSSVMEKPEVKAFTSILQAVVSTDPQDVQKGLAGALISTGAITIFTRTTGKGSDAKNITDKMFEDRIMTVFKEHCLENDLDIKSFNPLVALMRSNTLKERVIKAARKEDEIYSRALKEVVDQVADLCQYMIEMRTSAKDGITMPELFDGLLKMPTWFRELAADGTYSTKKLSYKEKIDRDLKLARQQNIGDDDEDDDDEQSDLPEDEEIGALIHLKGMAANKPNPIEFLDHVKSMQSKAAELCIDPSEWDEKQIKLMEQGHEYQPPPGVYLGTMHSTKGSEWKDVTVVMDDSFPRKKKNRKERPNEIPETPIFTAEQELQAERRLAYVALTRAKRNLSLVCPLLDPLGLKSQPSQFVAEAGLVMGENIISAVMASPDPTQGGDNYLMPSEEDSTNAPVDEAVEAEGMGKTASVWKVHVNVPYLSGNYNVSSLPF